ncbi:SDR family oxidoreductase [Acidicapsa ligni]|uniref:SDR family oxidoreductase n=1 Tax=Acidicapsa ligni TaxID=542300 RepID=UPI0021E025B0|nr:SDR family oxidoreductase [Acidicapsa ligni]
MTAERVALITGASSGFGLLTCVTLAGRGWRVLATMRDPARREKLDAAASAAGVAERIEVHALDVTNAEQIAALVDVVAVRSLRVDAVINNAGFALAGFAEDTTDAELRRQFETNFFGATAVTRAFLPLLRRQRSGHIVMISSVSGRMGFPGLGSYAASKFALEAWTETLRMEVESLGIEVVLIEPGAFETDIWGRNAIVSEGTMDAKSPNAERIARWRKRFENPKVRPDAQEVANAIARVLDDPKPKLRYVFGPDAKMGLRMRRWLPWSIYERMVIKGSGIDG